MLAYEWFQLSRARYHPAETHAQGNQYLFLGILEVAQTRRSDYFFFFSTIGLFICVINIYGPHKRAWGVYQSVLGARAEAHLSQSKSQTL